MHTSKIKYRQAFTLIEILVVVAIIALLIAILLPSLSRSREQSKMVICTSQLQQLMKAALLYTVDSQGRTPGVARCDAEHQGDYDSGATNAYITWFGTWADQITMAERTTNTVHGRAWQRAPRGGRLWKYYRNEHLLECPSAKNFNGKISYSTPENVALVLEDGKQPWDLSFHRGIPPLIEKVKHPTAAIQFLDEDENKAISNNSLDDGFGEGDMFADRHLGKTTVAFFDGHAEAHFFPRGKMENGIQTTEIFNAWMIQIAPFNCTQTPLPWNFRGRAKMPKFKLGSHWPDKVCTDPSKNPPGCG